jgi:hypothetical protein
LKNPILTKADFGSLEYGADDLVEVQIAFRYDWATCLIDGEAAPILYDAQ